MLNFLDIIAMQNLGWTFGQPTEEGNYHCICNFYDNGDILCLELNCDGKGKLKDNFEPLKFIGTVIFYKPDTGRAEDMTPGIRYLAERTRGTVLLGGYA